MSEEGRRLHEKLGYSASNNPFGDTKLDKKFVWKKRDEVRKKQKIDQESGASFYNEIEKVREARRQRERAVKEREEKKELEMRRREAAQYEDWEEKEEEFLQKQIKTRSKLRLTSGRSEPIDCIAKNLLILEDDEFTEPSELRPPDEVLDTLAREDIEQVIQDAKAYERLQGKNGKWLEYWRNVGHLSRYLLEKNDIHPAVASDVHSFLHNKSMDELADIVRQVKKKRRRGDSSTYWSAVESQARAARAKAKLRTLHTDILALVQSTVRNTITEEIPQHTKPVHTTPKKAKNDILGLDQTMEAIHMEESEYAKGLDEGEEFFIPNASPLPPSWLSSERTPPIKPRSINRVKTGFEWNKYNQTHYTAEEPPPKMVQGYKFNIFYPQLTDKRTPPTYVLETAPAEETPHLIIRFRAGPPYEEIAFKIVNLEWDRNPRHGFSSVFEHGILQLHFNFKRWRYRR